MTVIAALLAIACCIVLLECALYLRNVSHLPALADSTAPDPDVWPRVSVIIAARDEAAGVGAAMATRFEDDYPDLEIVFVDDRSTDGTGEIAAAVAAGDPRFRPVRVDELPDGWLGKVHAMQLGVDVATGEWLLFSDADVHMSRGAIRKAIAYALAENTDMVALVPEFRSPSVMVDAPWAIFARALCLMVDPAAVRDPRKKAAIGSGSFNLVSRAAFQRTPGFEHLRLETGDDVALAAMVKEAGGRLEMVGGRGCASVAIYRSVAEFLRGVEKNGSTTAAIPFAAMLAGAAVMLAVELSPLAAIKVAALAGGPAWLLALGVVALVATTAVNCSALWTSARTWAPGLLWPIGLCLMVFGLLRSTWLVHRRGGVMWRGTFYPIEALTEGRRFRF
jgi:hypothetical protein